MRRVAPVAGRDLPDRVEMLGGSTTTIVTSTTSSNVLPAADRHAFRLSNASRTCACRIRRSSLIARKMRPRAPGKTRVARIPIAPRPKKAASARTAVGASTIVRCQARLSEPMPEQAIARSLRPGAPAPRRPGAPPHGRASPFPGNGDLDHSATHISRRAPVTPPVTPHASASSRRHRRRTPIRPRRPAGPRTASEPCYPVRACCARVACTAL
ncbi:Uncharacterised protein [Burkholderia pseudomallei]|nr:Uncharacterised protein [Burkholderia pseudomallei]CAJ2906329.1 Uncharacterised protein [Burkholderia pseudomallei]CAJ3174186.1 Uncharacterised protein [Burkholderia pseudomallei]CAJ3473272.1 Uncharacterised protein [Burkholderia pseudomallei]CAJ3786888.1 Uncharacterised protein [Burkholderia pseudomallei]